MLSSPRLSVEGTVSAIGGTGGRSECASSAGGDGGMGRIRLSTIVEHCDLRGSWSHSFASCDPTPDPGVPGNVFIDAYPF